MAPSLRPSPVLAEPPASRRAAKRAARVEEEAGQMAPEMRYRVLQSTLKMETDFLDLADKKARFALVIMSAVNAAAVVFALRGVQDWSSSHPLAIALRVESLAYGAATLWYIGQAIQALRPRGERGALHALPTAIEPGVSMRVLFHSDIASRTRDDNRAMWDGLRLDNVTTELADQLHMVSRINVLKYRALGRLYTGVGLMTALLTTALLTEGARRLFGG
ncbi:MAG: hypothetical protein SFW08_07070 [Gemmatimonadaceae bacterium]|nr:hypothetical protein [Gemmatimonadaceae bacterium]